MREEPELLWVVVPPLFPPVAVVDDVPSYLLLPWLDEPSCRC
jgi:hypothetical protein